MKLSAVIFVLRTVLDEAFFSVKVEISDVCHRWILVKEDGVSFSKFICGRENDEFWEFVFVSEPRSYLVGEIICCFKSVWRAEVAPLEEKIVCGLRRLLCNGDGCSGVGMIEGDVLRRNGWCFDVVFGKQNGSDGVFPGEMCSCYCKRCTGGWWSGASNCFKEGLCSYRWLDPGFINECACEEFVRASTECLGGEYFTDFPPCFQLREAGDDEGEGKRKRRI